VVGADILFVVVVGSHTDRLVVFDIEAERSCTRLIEVWSVVAD